MIEYTGLAVAGVATVSFLIGYMLGLRHGKENGEDKE